MARKVSNNSVLELDTAIAEAIRPDTPDETFVQNVENLLDIYQSSPIQLSHALTLDHICALTARAAFLSFSCLKDITTLAYELWTRSTPDEKLKFLDEINTIVMKAYNPDDADANLKALGGLLMVWGNRGTTLWQLKSDRGDQLKNVVVSVVFFGEILCNRAEEAVANPTSRQFGLLATQLNMCAFVITRSVLHLITRSSTDFFDAPKLASTVAELMPRIVRVCLDLIKKLPEPDTLKEQEEKPNSEDAVIPEHKRFTLAKYGSKNPLWRCVNCVLWGFRHLWEGYWRGSLATDNIERNKSIAEVESAFSFGKGKSSRSVLLSSSKKARKADSKQLLKEARRKYGTQILDMFIDVIQFPHLPDEVGEGVYTAVYDILYHGTMLFGDELFEARSKFMDSVFWNHLIPAMGFQPGLKRSIVETPLEFVMLDTVELDRASRLEESATLALDRIVSTNKKNDGIFSKILNMLHKGLTESTTQGNMVHVEQLLATTNALFYDTDIHFVSADDTKLIISILNENVLPFISNPESDIFVQIRALDCAQAVTTFLLRKHLAPEAVAMDAFVTLQTPIVSDAGSRNFALLYTAHRNISDGISTGAARKMNISSHLDMNALAKSVLDMLNKAKILSSFAIARSYIQAKKLDADWYLRLAEAVTVETPGYIQRFVNQHDVEEPEGPRDEDMLLELVDLIEDLTYSVGELGHTAIIPVEKVISENFLLPLLDSGLMSDQNILEGVARVVGGLTYTLPKPSPTLWRFFEPLVTAYQDFPEQVDDLVRPISNFLSEGVEVFDAKPENAELVFKMINEFITLRPGHGYVDDDTVSISDLIEEFCFNSKNACKYVEKMVHPLCLLLQGRAIRNAGGDDDEHGLGAMGEAEEDSDADEQGGLFEGRFGGGRDGRGGRGRRHGAEDNEMEIEIGLAATRSIYRSILNCIRINAIDALKVLQQHMPHWFKAWKEFQAKLVGKKYRSDKVTTMAFVEILSLDSASIPVDLQPHKLEMLDSVISMAENVVDREVEIRKRTAVAILHHGDAAAEKPIQPEISLDASSHERRQQFLAAKLAQNRAAGGSAAPPKPAPVEKEATEEASPFENPFEYPDDDEEEEEDNVVDEEDEEDDEGAGDFMNEADLFDAEDGYPEEEDDDGEQDDEDADDDNDDDDDGAPFDQMIADDPNNENFDEFESETRQGYVSAMDPIDLPLYMDMRLKKNEQNYQELIALLNDDQYDSLQRLLAKAKRGPPSLVQLILNVIADRIEAFPSLELLNHDMVEALQNTISTRYETKSALHKIGQLEAKIPHLQLQL